MICAGCDSDAKMYTLVFPQAPNEPVAGQEQGGVQYDGRAVEERDPWYAVI